MQVPSSVYANTPPAEMRLRSRRDDSGRSVPVQTHLHELHTYVAYVKEEASTLLEEISTNGIAISFVNPSKPINRNYFTYPSGANGCQRYEEFDNTRATKSKDSRRRVRQQIYFLAARMERAD